MATVSSNTSAYTPSAAPAKATVIPQAPSASAVSSNPPANAYGNGTPSGGASQSSPKVTAKPVDKTVVDTYKVDAVVQSSINASVAQVNKLQTPVAQTQSATVSTTVAVTEKVAASFAGVTTPGRVDLPSKSLDIPAGDAVKLAAKALAPATVDLSKLAVSVGSGDISGSSVLELGKPWLDNNGQQTVPGLSGPVTSPVKGVNASSIVTDLGAKVGLKNVTVSTPSEIDKVEVPAQSLQSGALKSVQAVEIKTNEVKVSGLTDKAVGLDSLNIKVADMIKVLPPMASTPAVTVDPQPVAVGKIAADASASLVAKAVAATQITLPVPAATQDIKWNPGQTIKPIDLNVSTKDIIKTDDLLKLETKSFHQSVGTNDDINLSKMVNLPGLNADGDLLNKTTPSISGSDVLKVSKFNVDVSLASPELKLSHVTQGIHVDLDHTYTVPAVALNPYAGHSNAPAGAQTKADGGYDAGATETLKIVGAHTESPAHIG